MKKLLKDLHKRVRLEPSFLALLVVVALIAFVVLELLFGLLFGGFTKDLYNIEPLEESAVYGGEERALEDDLNLIIEAPPSNLNGAPITSGANRSQVLAVIVENYTPIRHTQQGLDDAPLVYEALAEGGITRLLALYDGVAVNKIGPVRSARPYFISWASEYLAPFVHVGGSQAALNNLASNFRVFNIDEFSDAKTIFRDNALTIPHNAFTSTGKILQRLNKDRYYKPLTVDRFPFKDPDETPGDINTISIDYSFAPYAVKYEYDPEDGHYARYNGGKRHHNIKPANILVQFVESEVLDDIGRLRLQTHGVGRSLVFRDGKVIEGNWQKDCSLQSKSQPMESCFTKFYDQKGFEIPLNRGPIWIEIVPADRAVNYF